MAQKKPNEAPPKTKEKEDKIELIYETEILSLYMSEETSDGFLKKLTFKVRKCGNEGESSEEEGCGSDSDNQKKEPNQAENSETTEENGMQTGEEDDAEPASKRLRLALEDLVITPECYEFMRKEGEASIQAYRTKKYPEELESAKKELENTKSRLLSSPNDQSLARSIRNLNRKIETLARHVNLMEEKDPVTHFLRKSGYDLIHGERCELITRLEETRKTIANVQAQEPGHHAGQTTDKWLQDERIKGDLTALSATYHKDPIETALAVIKATGSAKKRFDRYDEGRERVTFWETLGQTTDPERRRLMAIYGWYHLPELTDRKEGLVNTVKGQYYDEGYTRPTAEEAKQRGYVFEREQGKYIPRGDDKMVLEKAYVPVLEAFELISEDLPETYGKRRGSDKPLIGVWGQVMPDSNNEECWKKYQRHLVLKALIGKAFTQDDNHMHPVGKWKYARATGWRGMPDGKFEACAHNIVYYQADGTYVVSPSAICTCGYHTSPILGSNTAKSCPTLSLK